MCVFPLPLLHYESIAFFVCSSFNRLKLIVGIMAHFSSFQIYPNAFAVSPTALVQISNAVRVTLIIATAVFQIVFIYICILSPKQFCCYGRCCWLLLHFLTHSHYVHTHHNEGRNAPTLAVHSNRSTCLIAKRVPKKRWQEKRKGSWAEEEEEVEKKCNGKEFKESQLALANRMCNLQYVSISTDVKSEKTGDGATRERER